MRSQVEVPALVPVGEVVSEPPLQSPSHGLPSREGLSFADSDLHSLFDRYQSLLELKRLGQLWEAMPRCAVRGFVELRLCALEAELGVSYRQMELFA